MEELKKKLTPIQYKVTQEKDTEYPFTGEYWNKKDLGEYECIVCSQKLFESQTKYDSGCGWPSFYQAEDNSCKEIIDTSHGMVRTEVVCSKCGAHLGHIFNDGPAPTRLRYCINSASLNFIEKK